MPYDFAVVGGDSRFFYLAKFLANKKFRVVGFDLFNFKNEDCNFKIANSLQEALLNAKNWVLPIPVSRDGNFLNSSSELKIGIGEVLKLVKKNTVIFGGAFSADFFSILKERANFVYDFLKNESFAIFNANLTAQAAVAQVILKSPVDFNFVNCLVLGFGRCGKFLALRLKNICSNVAVSMRNCVEMAWANALGFEVLKLSDLKSKKILNLRKFDIIFNTIPKKILSGDLLNKLNEEVLFFDITPHGIDQAEFAKKSIDAVVSLQIPGNFKFKSSATYLANLIVEVLKSKNLI